MFNYNEYLSGNQNNMYVAVFIQAINFSLNLNVISSINILFSHLYFYCVYSIITRPTNRFNLIGISAFWWMNKESF